MFVTILICTALTNGLPSASLLSALTFAIIILGSSFVFSYSALFLSYSFNLLYTISYIAVFCCLTFILSRCSLISFSSSPVLYARSASIAALRDSRWSLVRALLSSSSWSSYRFYYIERLRSQFHYKKEFDLVSLGLVVTGKKRDRFGLEADIFGEAPDLGLHCLAWGLRR